MRKLCLMSSVVRAETYFQRELSVPLRSQGSFRGHRRPELNNIREDRPIVNVLLPTEVNLRLPNCFGKRRSFDRERSLAYEVLVPGVVANRFDETNVE